MLPDTIKSIPLSKERPYKSKRKYEGAIWIPIDELSVVKKKKENAFLPTSRKPTKINLSGWKKKKQTFNYFFIIKKKNKFYS